MRGAAAVVLVVLAAVVSGGCGLDGDEKSATNPGSTLKTTIKDEEGNGTLGTDEGEPLVDRTDLSPKARATTEQARVGHLTDTHVRDEESPARVPFLDRLGAPVTSTFRPQEAVSAQVLTSAIRTINQQRPSGVVISGDLIDSAQRNELTQFLTAVRGGRVDPDSGAEGYRGVQQASNPDGFFYRPALDAPRFAGLLARAQRTFISPGLRAPWWPALGNHDVLVQGELPPSPRTAAIATGSEMLQTFDPALRDLVDDLPRSSSGDTPDLRDVPREAIDALLAEGVPGDTTRVPADPARAHLSAQEVVDRLRDAAGVDAQGRLNYAATTDGGVRVVVLDSVDRGGGAGGTITDREVAFLDDALSDPEPAAFVVVSHHGLDRAGGEADRALTLLAREPRVVAELHGDTHRHAIEPVRTPRGGYWRIGTASLADWPQQGRMVRLLTGPDGARAIETWVVDHAGNVDGSDLAGAGRRLAYLDAQGGRPQRFAATRRDRNARLWLRPAPSSR